jgi:hypothetical protein
MIFCNTILDSCLCLKTILKPNSSNLLCSSEVKSDKDSMIDKERLTGNFIYSTSVTFPEHLQSLRFFRFVNLEKSS